jgi:hypothetical protein
VKDQLRRINGNGPKIWVVRYDSMVHGTRISGGVRERGAVCPVEGRVEVIV